jgi:hypothetical protein
MNELNPDYIPPIVAIPVALVLCGILVVMWIRDRRKGPSIIEDGVAEVAPPALMSATEVKMWPNEQPFVWVKKEGVWTKAFPKIQENGQWRDMTWDEVEIAFKENQEWLSLLQSGD